MQKLIKNYPLISSAVLGFIFLIPFIVLEIVNRWKFSEGFPFAVFTFTWALQTVFILILLKFIKKRQSGKTFKENPFIIILQIVSLVLIAYIWGGWIIDQWPCLMGVPNCD